MLVPQAIHATIPQFGPAFRTLLHFCRQRFAPVFMCYLGIANSALSLCWRRQLCYFPCLACSGTPCHARAPAPARTGWLLLADGESKWPLCYSGISKTKREAWLLAQIECCFPKVIGFSFDGWPPRTRHQSLSIRARSSVSTLAPNFPHCLSTSFPSKEKINVPHNRAQTQCRKNYARVVTEDTPN